ncbi:MAG: hypothetical protein J5809_05805 [Selenomonadaceae bacterium]|nr:hypothetical protein [Selenomonadaceae bacterium]
MKKIFLLAATIIFLRSEVCLAEDLKFLDANGDTGYFVDADSDRMENDSVFRVNLVIIRLDVNEMDIIELRVNHVAKSYMVCSTRTLSYDDRTELRADNTQRPERGYAEKSLMGDLVQIILFGGD